MRVDSRHVLAAALAGALLGCAVPDGLLDDKPCPCADGYRCEAGRCVPGGSADAGMDAGAPDAGRDAGVDGSPTRDAGSGDGGQNGGQDAGDDGGAPPTDAGPSGPVAAWSCEAFAGAVVPDVTGHGHDARCDAAGCPTIVPGRVGMACDFGPEDRRLRVSYDAAFVPEAPGDALTVALFVRPHGRSASSAVSVPYGTMTANTWQVHLPIPGGEITPRFVAVDATGITGLPATTTIPHDVWSHLAVTYEAGARRIYVDGVLSAEVVGEPVLADTHDLLIGADENAGAVTLPFDGAIDELRVWDRRLTDAEIAALASE